MCTTCTPAASSRAAAAITSITMKGGTSLRADAVTSSFADFSICSNCLNLLDEQISVRTAPRCCRICRLGLSRAWYRRAKGRYARAQHLDRADGATDSAARRPVARTIRNDDASTTCQAAVLVASLPRGRGRDRLRARARQRSGAGAEPAQGPAADPRRRERAAPARLYPADPARR